MLLDCVSIDNPPDILVEVADMATDFMVWLEREGYDGLSGHVSPANHMKLDL